MERNNNNNRGRGNNNTQYEKVGLVEAKEWMERRLSKFKSGIPKKEAVRLANEWYEDFDSSDIDHRIIEIEAAQISKLYARWHVPRLGNMQKERPEGVFRLFSGQLNSAASEKVRDVKVDQIKRVLEEWDVQGGGVSELGVNWSSFPSSYTFASWFIHDVESMKSSVAYNRNPTEPDCRHRPGGIGLLACKELAQYCKTSSGDFRKLGRWNSWMIYNDPKHVFRYIQAYNVGGQKPTGLSTIYQQQLRYIQERDLDTNPRRMFKEDFVAQLKQWRKAGDRLLIGMDMNEPILDGPLAVALREANIGLVEATHGMWGANEPHTFIGGSSSIDAVWHTDDVEVVSTSLLSFHEGMGDHRTALIDVSTRSAIGKNEFRVVRPLARRLNTRNHKSVEGYNPHFKKNLKIHRMRERVAVIKEERQLYPPTPEQTAAMEIIDQQTTELQRNAESQCRKITKVYQPFSPPVKIWHFRRRAYQGLLKRVLGKSTNSNIIKQAHQAEILSPKSLTAKQCNDGIRYCTRRIHQMDGNALRKTHLRDRLIEARDLEEEKRARGVKQTIEREATKKTWRWIGGVTDDPRLGATAKVQKVIDGEVVDVTDKDEMEKEIQQVTEKRFELAHSATISMSSLAEKLGYLSDTAFAEELFAGTAELPSDLDASTTLVLNEIAKVGMEIRTTSNKIFVITPEQFRYYWKKVKESTSSSISTIHFGHYKAAAKDDYITAFLSEKLTVTAQLGVPPSRWGNGLQVMLEKIAGVALVNKLRAILLMEADFNYFNKWAFGYEAMQTLYEMNWIPNEQYSQAQSTSGDSKMDTRLTSDLSRQLRQPYAETSADAANCYDRINHIILSFLLLAITGMLGSVVCMLRPIQVMSFFQRTALGDSTSFMGGPNRIRPLQGVCQGNGAGPACWLMLSALLMHCYENQGFGARILSPMSKKIISFLGTIYVDDTNLVEWVQGLLDPKEVYSNMQDSLLMWGSLLCATGGAFKPEKCYWYMVDYACEDGVWDYAAMQDAEMLIPMPDGTYEPIQQLDVHDQREMLGVYSCPAGDDTVHLEEKVVKRAATWTARTKNGHLPAKFAWLSYRFKLWPGIRYGLETLSTPLAVARDVLKGSDFRMLSFLGVNRNIKRQWRTLPRAFGGVGLFSFVIEQMICWLNILIQHFGVPSVLGRKFSASLEALQLEIGCIGNPLTESYASLHILATTCWFKWFWERLSYFKFEIHLDYPTLKFPRDRDKLLVKIFLEHGYKGEALKSLNRCRLCLQLLFLSDLATADGRRLEPSLMLPPKEDDDWSWYEFPREIPTPADWVLWMQFWTSYTDTDFSLPSPMGKWVAPTHRIQRWFYNAAEDIVEEADECRVHYYHRANASSTRQGLQYVFVRSDHGVATGLPLSVKVISEECIIRQSVGPPLASEPDLPNNFWLYLKSLGGEWMWEDIDKQERKDIKWLVDALRNGTAILCTDGSFDRDKAPDVSGAGWIIVCTETHRSIRGSFYERSSTASAYRGELLGLTALHTLVYALGQFYNIDIMSGTMCCDNIGALQKSSYRPLRIKTGSAQADLLRAIRTLKTHDQLKFTYKHVDSHQDRHKLWHQLTLMEQLNVKCNGLAKSAVFRSMRGGLPEDRGKQLLPLERAAVFVNGHKLTSDVSKEVRFRLGYEEACRFYTDPIVMQRNVNIGGLGWSKQRFDGVDWRAIDQALASKPDMYGIWLCKQVTGTCATRANMSRIHGLADDKCPNCQQHRETSSHLNRCPNKDRTLLFKESVESLNNWLNTDNKTDTEVAYWLIKYLQFRGTRTMSSLGPMSPAMATAAASQDEIGWVEFLHGRVSTDFAAIQFAHCAVSPCRMNGSDWMKKLVSHLLQISHSQWMFRNFVLHDKVRGYLILKERKEVLQEIERLVECDIDDIPQESRFLLEMDFEALYNSSFDKQSYWVRAIKAARRAGRRAALIANQAARQGASARRRAARRRTERLVINTGAVEAQLREDLNLPPLVPHIRPHPAHLEALNPVNKRLRHPD